jgi:hypothetical protein
LFSNFSAHDPVDTFFFRPRAINPTRPVPNSHIAAGNGMSAGLRGAAIAANESGPSLLT